MSVRPRIFPAGTVINGEFEILGILERSSALVLYAARELVSGKEHYLKVLHRKGSIEDFSELAEFENEARCLARLVDPNILRVYDYKIAESGEPYIVCEYVNFRRLSELVASVNGLPLHRALPIFAQICDAVDAAHQQNVLLRKISLQNVWICEIESFEIVKLHGLSHALQFDLDRSFLPWRNGPEEACFVSPELLLRQGADGGNDIEQPISRTSLNVRSDVFSVGCLVYNVLTGLAPFTVSEVQMSARDNSFLSAKRFNLVRPDLEFPSDLEPVIRKAMELDPSYRYESLAHFKNAMIFTLGKQSAANLDLLLNRIRSLLFGIPLN